MSSGELAMWLEDYLDEPWDSRTISEQLNMLYTLFANVYRNRKDRKEPWTNQDFLPGRGTRPEPKIETKAERAERLKRKLAMLVPMRPKKRP